MRAASYTLLGILFCIGLLGGTAQGESLPRANVDYSADTTMNINGEGKAFQITGKVFVTKDKERREQNIGGQKAVVIVRHDKGLNWTVIPGQNIYMEFSSSMGKADNPDPISDWYEKEIKMTKLGSESIDGTQVNKYKVSGTEQGGGSFEGFVWLTKDNILMKVEGTASEKGQATMIEIQLQNLRIEKQDSTLFEIPAGYHKFQMPTLPSSMNLPLSDPGKFALESSSTPTMAPNAEYQNLKMFRDEALKEIENAKKALQEK